MAAVKLTVHGFNDGVCSLSGKEGGVMSVTIEPDTTPVNLSPKSFQQLLKMKCGQDTSRPVAPASPGPVLQRPASVPSAVPSAIPMSSAGQVK